MRKASIAAFFTGLVTYPFAFHFTTRLGTWVIGRTLSVASVLLLVTSVVLAILAPPTRERKRIWWAVPATVIAIAIIYFDWIGFGFAL
jgi:uncharacterized protein (DUF2062 family)